jgi:uncharacterized membrane protein
MAAFGGCIYLTFKEEAKAIEASQKLNELEIIGDITIYERVILKKNADGETVVLQADTAEGGGLTTISGMAVGALVESDNFGFAEDFISGAADHLQPGMTAVIAEIEESDPVFVDSSLTPLGATLTRSDVDYEYTRHSDEEIDELDEEIAGARTKLKSALENDKAKFRKKIEKHQKKITDLEKQLQAVVQKDKEAVKEGTEA